MGVGATPAPRLGPRLSVRRRYELGDGPGRADDVCQASPQEPDAALLDAWALIPEERRARARAPGLPDARTKSGACAEHAGANSASTANTRLPGLGSHRRPRRRFTNSPSASSSRPSTKASGLPVLEAMARGDSGRVLRPRLARRGRGRGLLRRSSIRRAPSAIADAVDAILSSAELAARLREAGREQARRFTWSATARGTLGVYERALTS